MIKVIFIHPEKGQAEKSSLSEFDDEQIIVCLMASDVQPVKIEVDGSHVSFSFLAAEVDKVGLNLVTTAPMMVDYRKVISARSAWRNALMMAKTSR